MRATGVLLTAVACAMQVGAEDKLTQAHIDQKAMDLLEERRQLLGTFPRLTSEQTLDYMLSHLGQNGLFFAGVFPRDYHDSSDHFYHRKLFHAWEALAKDQSFLAGFGAPDKQWVFGHTNDRAMGQSFGCPPKGWNYACVLMWKTSVDGTHLVRAMPILFNDEVPDRAALERALQRVASQRIEPHTEL